MKRIIMRLDTLACPSCMQEIEHTVPQQSGVSSTKVLFNASKIKTNFDPDEVHPEQLAAVVEKLSYEIQLTKVKEAQIDEYSGRKICPRNKTSKYRPS